jgi:hypothetical protein
MRHNPDDRGPDDVVRVAVGFMIQVEVWRDAVGDAGIDAWVVTDHPADGLGRAFPGSVELWVRRAGAGAAAAAIRDAEESGR